MATTKIWDVTDRLDRVVRYVMNPEKTDLERVLSYVAQESKTTRQYVTGINCTPETAVQEMRNTKLQYAKTDGILAYHAEQAFIADEVDADTAHEIGVRLAQELWGDRFQVVVTTHLDKAHLHNHFVLNSVSFTDGLRYYDNKKTYARMREVSDSLCKEYGLSVINEPTPRGGKAYAEWQAEQEGRPTWRGLIRSDVDQAIKQSYTFTEFLSRLHEMGYEVKTGVKYIAVRPEGKERFVRLKTLGEDYTQEKLTISILRNNYHAHDIPQSQSPKRRRYHLQKPKHAKKKLSGLQALYYYYLYRMGILPQRKEPSRAPFLFREDMLRLGELSRQIKFMVEHKLNSSEAVRAYGQTRQHELTGLSGQRRSKYNRLRRCQDDGKAAAIKTEIAALSGRIAALRKEVTLCDAILVRRNEMRGKLEAIKKGSEVKQPEQMREKVR